MCLKSKKPRIARLLKIIFLLTLISSCGNIREPEYRSIKNFKIDSLGFDQSKVRVEVIYFNPNNFGVKLKEIDCEIFFDSTRLGRFSHDSLIDVKAHSDFTVPLIGLVTISDVVKDPFQVLSGKEFFIRVNGSARVGKSGFFRIYPIRYEGRHAIDLFK